MIPCIIRSYLPLFKLNKIVSYSVTFSIWCSIFWAATWINLCEVVFLAIFTLLTFLSTVSAESNNNKKNPKDTVCFNWSVCVTIVNINGRPMWYPVEKKSFERPFHFKKANKLHHSMWKEENGWTWFSAHPCNFSTSVTELILVELSLIHTRMKNRTGEQTQGVYLCKSFNINSELGGWSEFGSQLWKPF